MSGDNQNLQDSVRKWVQFADDDLRYACYGMDMGQDAPFRLAAYHAQQCAEKYIKAYLVYQGIDFPRTHNIAQLLELCPERDLWEDSLESAEELSPYAISARYPGDEGPVREVEAQRAIEIAESVKNEIRL
ncbi:MAG: HEPN domain-containing protein [Candidatus Latescibacterota bacterium]